MEDTVLLLVQSYCVDRPQRATVWYGFRRLRVSWPIPREGIETKERQQTKFGYAWFRGLFPVRGLKLENVIA